MAGGGELADLGERASREVRVEKGAAAALAMPGLRCTDPLGNLGGPFAAPPADVGPTHGEELDVELEEVEQQLPDRRPVPVQSPEWAGALPVRVTEAAAWAGAHCCGEEERRR